MEKTSENEAGGGSFYPSRRRRLKQSDLLAVGGRRSFGRLVDLVQGILAAPMVFASLCDDDRQVIVAQKGLPPTLDIEDAAMPARSICAEVVRRGRPLSTGEPEGDRLAEALAAEGGEPLAYLGVPLVLPSGEVVGVLVACDRRERRWSEAEFGHMRTVAAILGEEIETRASEARWRNLFEDMQECFYVAEAIRDGSGRMADFRYVDVNPAFERIPGRANAVGRRVRELLPGIAEQLVSDYASLMQDGRPKLMESFTGGEWYEVRARRLDDDRFAVTFHNIGERKRTEMKLAEIEERRRLAIETGEVGILDLDLGARTMECDERGARFHGLVGRTRVDFDEVARFLHKSDRAALKAQVTAVLAGSASGISIQYRFTGIDDGRQRWLYMNAKATHDGGGGPLHLVGAVRDVSHRVEAEERRALLNAELSHRLKNTLAIVSSIITQTLRSATDVPTARKALSERIQALSKTHDILLSGQRDGAAMDAVIAAATSVHDEGRRVSIEGPRLAVGPKASLSLSMIVHELATNAGKYGALSAPGGRVAARWRLSDGLGERTPLIVFEWTESGGPPVVPPVRKGFGTRLIEMGLSGAAEASATITYAPDGLRCRIVAPLAEISTADEAEAAE